ncbi:carbon catabolite repressor protein 4 homolog 4 isoform X2 [Abrus precatorius]|uniref:Carbon catabolite repressor protein 4 homolog 4 isoform X2 n=2 Tax=Abrus precatorius TaxID=3816 RepID=A0A8B8LXP5_ABRPR|nr:carbon catabolite repressor protein 4 homolog 4 isoform X2 [Abrus precatorius]
MLKAVLAITRFSTRSVVRKMSYTPAFPKFVSFEGTDITKPDGFRFRLVSYNILAQAYVKSILFPHSPSPCLKWKLRSNAILTVLKNLRADFFCLQEVDEYDSFYKGRMQELGYSSVYMKRNGQKRDGCGLFYKNDRAELVLEEKIEYNDLVKLVQNGNSSKDDEHSNVQTVQPDEQTDVAPKNEDRGDPNDPSVRLKRNCVGIMAAFKLKDPSCHVIVANTHLYWDPEWADVKLAQAKYLLSRLAKFKTLVSDRYECTPEVIVAGDFNSMPGDMVYQYLVTGNPSSKLMPNCLDEPPPIPLCSVYASLRGEPPFTNYTPGFTGTLDYILFSPSNRIKPISFLQLPDSDATDIVGGLPNFSYPSDHLPIGAEFEIIKE